MGGAASTGPKVIRLCSTCFGNEDLGQAASELNSLFGLLGLVLTERNLECAALLVLNYNLIARIDQGRQQRHQGLVHLLFVVFR